MFDVFISYARSTEDEAQRIAAGLREAGHDVWRDDELPPHLPYADVIEARLRAAKAVVVIWSANAVRSHWVRAEADLAREAGTLVQVSIDGTTPPLPFNQIQCVQLGGWSGAPDAPDWCKVLASVDALKRRPGTPPPAVPAVPPPAAPAVPPRTAGSRAIVYVPPFTDLAPAGTEDFLAEGLREDVIEALSRHSSLTVRAGRGSGETGGAAAYSLETQVRRIGSRVRISARLIGAADGEAIWSERFDDASDDPFGLQDRVAMSISANVDSAIRREQIRAVPTVAGSAAPVEDVYLNAVKLINGAEPPGYFAALDLLARVVELRPDHASAWAATALAHANIVMLGAAAPGGDHRAAGVAAAQRSLSITDSDSHATGLASVALAYLGEPVEVARGLIERVVALNPSYAVAWFWSGTIHLIAGDLDTCIAHFDTVLRLDPRTSMRPLVLAYTGAAHALAGRHEVAAVALNQAHRLRPQVPWAALFLAASLAHAGQTAEAREMLARCDALDRPDRYSFPLHRPEHRDFLAGGLHRAGAGAA
jgi:adenylate cyclase